MCGGFYTQTAMFAVYTENWFIFSTPKMHAVTFNEMVDFTFYKQKNFKILFMFEYVPNVRIVFIHIECLKKNRAVFDY